MAELLDDASTLFLTRPSHADVLRALGFHVALEYGAGEEFRAVDSFLTRVHPDLVRHVQRNHNYDWISLHTIVEDQHFAAGLHAVADAVSFYAHHQSGESAVTLIAEGANAFASLQKRYYSELFKELETFHSSPLASLSRRNLPIAGAFWIVQYASPADWAGVCALERDLFPGVEELFTPGCLQTSAGKFPQGLIVVKQRDELVGYAAVFPLTSAGEAAVRVGNILTVCSLAPGDLSDQIDERTPAVFFEVVAFREDASRAARKIVWSQVVKMLRHHVGRIYVSPVSGVGERMVTTRGFRPLTYQADRPRVYERTGFWHERSGTRPRSNM